MIEREPELAAVAGLLGAGGGSLVVEGGAGIGKTSLLSEACRQADARGYALVRARGSELEADFAYGVVRQLFERRVVTAEPAERDVLLAGPAAAAAPLLTGSSGPDVAYDTSFAVLHGLYWVAANLAGCSPLLIVVDDAHWADAASLRWLSYLAPRIEGLPLAVLVALRPGEPAASGALLATLRAEATTTVRPGLLSPAGVAAAVRGVAGGRERRVLCCCARGERREPALSP